jgi:hypothetical protein
MDPDSAAALSDASPDLEQFQAQGAGLGTAKFAAVQMLSQQPERTGGKGVEKQPKLIGQKAVTAEPIVPRPAR